MPRYGFCCPTCGAEFDLERPVTAAGDPAVCIVCGESAARMFTAPRLMFSADPRDNRPYWHHHDGYGHSHPPRRGRHRAPEGEH
jgi:putative FmdB family regulatory protein